MRSARVLLLGFDKVCLGPRVLASYLREHGVHVDVVLIDCDKAIYTTNADYIGQYATQCNRGKWGCWNLDSVSDAELETLGAYVADNGYDIVGVSSNSFASENARQVLRYFKNKDVVTIAGGVGVTIDPMYYATDADYVCIGFGEAPMLEAARDLESTISGNAAGLHSLRNGRLVHKELSATIDYTRTPPLDSAVSFMIDGRVIDHDLFYQGSGAYYTLSARGCVGRCAYCTSSHLRKNASQYNMVPYVKRDTDHLIEELSRAKSDGAEVISFLNDYMIGTRSELNDFFMRYKKEIGLPFIGALHIKQMLNNRDVLYNAIDAGLVQTVIGVQHGVESFRQSVYLRQESDEDILEYATILHENNVKKQYHLIVGCFCESEAMLEDSVAFFCSVPFKFGFDEISSYHYMPLPCTEVLGLRGSKEEYDHDPKTLMVASMIANYAPLLPEDEVRDVFRSPTIRKNPRVLFSYCNDIVYRALKEAREPVMDKELIKPIYSRYLEDNPESVFVVWGVSVNYQENKDIFADYSIAFFVDNNKERWGDIVDGAEIKSPEDLKELKNVVVFICSAYKAEIEEQISRINPSVIVA